MERTYSAKNSLYIFISFAIVGGFLESYTYLLHGGVFCNAQTGNIVLLALSLIDGEFFSSLHYLSSIGAYIAGILVSAVLPQLFRRGAHLFVACLELAALAGIAFIPAACPDWYTYASVSFLCALQYNTFTECRGAALSTTFCTNNLRQMTLNLYRGARERKAEHLKKSGIYALIILCFAGGAIAGGFAAHFFGNYSALCCCALLVPVILFLALHREPPVRPEQLPAEEKAKA